MAAGQRVICASHELAEGGRGVRFSVEIDGSPAPAFAVRHGGRVHAYLNRCAHVGVELDWLEGEFFDRSRLYLVCSTHGATYEPDTGLCVTGPCRGQSLAPLAVAETGGAVVLIENTTKVPHG